MSTHDATTRAVIDHLAEHPDDTLSWAALADLLEAAEAPAAAILVAQQCGLWRGTREQWEQQGPSIVGVVPIKHLWILGIAPSIHEREKPNIGFWIMKDRRSELRDPDDIPPSWCAHIPTENNRNDWKFFESLESAYQWLQDLAIYHARSIQQRA